MVDLHISWDEYHKKTEQLAVKVHDDGWEIAGCPVNGPAITASGEEVAVAWFTGAGDVPRTNLAFSKDGGASFGAPIVIDDGSPLGRVDLLKAGDGSVVVVWLEGTGGEGAEVRLRRVTPDGDVTESVAVSTTSAERPSGFPRLAQTGDGALLLAWTDVSGGEPQVRVTKLQLGR